MNINLKNLRKTTNFLCICTVFVVMIHRAQAQSLGEANAALAPFESQYFTNRYLGNPAMAGLDSVLLINMAYRKQFIGLPGSPVTESLSADFNSGKRVGLGLIAINDKAGLIRQSRFALTYAYHLPLADNGRYLHFGISAAYGNSRLDPKDITGDVDDPSIAEYNENKNAFDVDYGMAYTDRHITAQVSFKNLIGSIRGLNDTVADAPIIYSAIGYRFNFGGAINSVEPQISVSGIHNYKSVFDIGANLIMFNQILNIFALYHSSQSFSAGVGVNYKGFITVQGAYKTQTSGLKDYSDGNYEIDVRINLFRNKK